MLILTRRETTPRARLSICIRRAKRINLALPKGYPDENAMRVGQQQCGASFTLRELVNAARRADENQRRAGDTLQSLAHAFRQRKSRR